jgi:hypothetical protein
MLPQLAGALGIDEFSLVEAGVYRGESSTPSPASRALARALPLSELPEERFEDLIAELMDLMFETGHASRFGSRGHKQDGIDVLVAHAGGFVAVGQCKRYATFGPGAVKKAIEEVTLTAAKYYLFLSRETATPAARKEAAKHPGWELWDGEDISRFIRNLPLDRSVRIVDTYFPGHREPFLGVATPAPWLTPEEHFDVARSSLFNHEWQLVGRGPLVDALIASAFAPDASLAFLIGAGGMGKTRILKATIESPHAERSVVRILPGDTNVVSSDFEFLPTDDGLTIIVDDAHELQNPSAVVGGIWRRNSSASIVLATRPYGRRSLKEALAQGGLLPAELAELEIDDLDLSDAMLLAREALGEDHSEAAVRRLAQLTTDSPLATVVGGTLISRGKLTVDSLEQDANVRDQIMRGFHDGLVHDSSAADPHTRSAVLDAIAATQPFRLNDTNFRDMLSAIVGRPYDELRKHLRALENAGILRRRGEALRIVPDLLGDVVLADAAMDIIDGSDTGYLARMQRVATGPGAENLFVNINRVDWQVRDRRRDAPSLTDSLWSAFQRRIASADLIDRRSLAGLLAKVAYFQPARSLTITRWLIDNPSTHLSAEHEGLRHWIARDYTHVLEALPLILKYCAMTLDTLPEALQQLWRLAADDVRPLNSTSEHPIRILRDLAEISIAKPLAYNKRIVDVARGWFADVTPHSPFEVLEPMLATEGHESSFRAHTLTFRPFSLEPSSVRTVRQQVIDLAFEELRSADLKRAAAAVKAIQHALRYPTGTFGREVTTEERDAWTPEFVETIEQLGQATQADIDPALFVAIRDALYWHQNFSTTATQPAAEQAVALIPDDLAAQLALAIHDGWGRLIRDRGDDYEAMERKRRDRDDRALAGLADRKDADVVDLVANRLTADAEAYGSIGGSPEQLIARLVEARPRLADQMLAKIHATLYPSAFDRVLPAILAAVAKRNAAEAVKEARAIFAGESVERRRAVSMALGTYRGRRGTSADELRFLFAIAVDPDIAVRRNVIRGALALPRASALQIIASVRFADSSALADDIFMCFGREDGVGWRDFSESQLERIRANLVEVGDISGHFVTEAFIERSASEPSWVLGVLRDRISHAEQMESLDGYQPIPFDWAGRLRIRESPDSIAILRDLLTWIAEDPQSWIRSKMGGDLFAASSGPFDDEVIELLADALNSGSPQIVAAVASVLHDAPRTLIWDRPDFVQTAIRAAERLGPDGRAVIGGLWGATTSGLRSGTPGEPFPETIEQRDRSLEIAKQLPHGSAEAKFYLDIADSAMRDIARELNEDAIDGREW